MATRGRVALRGLGLLGLLLAAPLPLLASSDAVAAEVAQLRAEIETLTARLADLEARLDADSAVVAPVAEVPIAGLDELQLARLEQAVTGAERREEAQLPEEVEPDPIRIGGALRFNFNFREDVADSRARRGDSSFDLFRLNVDGELGDVLISAEYRHRPGLDVIRHGWIGYRFADDSELQLGIHRTPFGLLPFSSHNFWDGVPFYAGFADNADLGVLYRRQDGPFETHLAFYKNEELGNADSLSRYAPDVVRDGDRRNDEINRFNARLAYTHGLDTGCEHEVGLSGQRADLANADTGGRGSHWAAAAHLDSRCGRWNLQLQGVRYVYDPDHPDGVDNHSLRLGAFGSSYDLAAKGRLAVANLAYNFDTTGAWVDQVICYNNYSRLFKDVGGGRDSELNTIGCGVGVGPLFAYFDLILARNMIFFGEGSMAAGGEDRWRSRFNINLGYYW